MRENPHIPISRNLQLRHGRQVFLARGGRHARQWRVHRAIAIGGSGRGRACRRGGSVCVFCRFTLRGLLRGLFCHPLLLGCGECGGRHGGDYDMIGTEKEEEEKRDGRDEIWEGPNNCGALSNLLSEHLLW